MAQNTTRVAGRHFLQIPGPAPIGAVSNHRGHGPGNVQLLDFAEGELDPFWALIAFF